MLCKGRVKNGVLLRRVAADAGEVSNGLLSSALRGRGINHKTHAWARITRPATVTDREVHVILSGLGLLRLARRGSEAGCAGGVGRVFIELNKKDNTEADTEGYTKYVVRILLVHAISQRTTRRVFPKNPPRA